MERLSGVSSRTVRKWCDRFVAEGLDGLLGRPRSGRPPRFSVEQRCEVIAIACDDPGAYGFAGQSVWTYDSLTDAVHRHVSGFRMSRTSIWRTLTQNELKPHKMRIWLHSPDPQFKEKVNAVVSLYLHPPEDAVVVCVDEKPGIQAVERKYETRRPIPGRPGRFEFESIRHGTQALLSAFNIRTGKVTAVCRDQRTGDNLVALMERVAQEHPHAVPSGKDRKSAGPHLGVRSHGQHLVIYLKTDVENVPRFRFSRIADDEYCGDGAI